MIGFVHPWMLLGLVAAAIPVVLHLLQRREPPTVPFPAVRYLIAATEEHQRRLKLRNLLLLALRTLLVVALVLAAAGPTVRGGGLPVGRGHAPGALVLVLDNSASSGAVLNGTPRLAELQAAARRVLGRATADDALWLLAADGLPRRGDPGTLRSLVDRLAPSPRRLDLGEALRIAREVLATQPRRGEIVLVSDLQATALSPASPDVPLLVIRPDRPPPRNLGIAALGLGTQPWSSGGGGAGGGGGRAVVTLVGDSGPPVPVTVRLGDRPARPVLATAGASVTLDLPPAPAGWWPVTAELDPDELRADDRRVSVVRVAPVARARWNPEERYVAAACEVLEANRRLSRGDEITVGALGPGASIVEPPADPAELGALNRALEGRGVGWTYGAPVEGSEVTDSGAAIGRVRVTRRYRLEPAGGGRSGVLVRVGRDPWVVRGGDVVLLGSRLDPGWSELPLSAWFMPFMDFLLNRAARGEVALVDAVVGEPAPLPEPVTEVRRGREVWRVEGGAGASFRPPEPGIYFLLADRARAGGRAGGPDTVGALAANLDPRESRLAPASDDEVRRLWRGARVTGAGGAEHLVFAAGARGDLVAPLLWFGVALGLAEVGLASGRRRKA